MQYCGWYSGVKITEITEYKESGVRLLRYFRLEASETETRLGSIDCDFSCLKLACCAALDVGIARSGRYGTGIHTQSRCSAQRIQLAKYSYMCPHLAARTSFRFALLLSFGFKVSKFQKAIHAIVPASVHYRNEIDLQCILMYINTQRRNSQQPFAISRLLI